MHEAVHEHTVERSNTGCRGKDSHGYSALPDAIATTSAMAAKGDMTFVFVKASYTTTPKAHMS